MLDQKTIALIEFGWSGHLPSYFKAYCTALLKAGYRVLALCPRPSEVTDWAEDQHLAVVGQLKCIELPDKVKNRYWVRKFPQLANAQRFLECARILQREETADGMKIHLAFFSCLYNGIIPSPNWLDRNFPHPWVALLLDSSCVRLQPWRRWLAMRSFDSIAAFRANHCQGLTTLDAGIAEPLSGRLSGKRVYPLPELGNAAPPLAADFALPLPSMVRTLAGGRRIIGCCGQFSLRKGAYAFLQMAHRCRSKPWFFFWAGEDESRYFSRSEKQWITNFLASKPANCLIHRERVHDENEYNALIAQSDLLFAVYKDHPGSSNTISKAADFEKRILVSEGYCMAEETRRYRLGLCVPQDDLDAMEKAVCQLLGTDAQLPAPLFENYRRMHTRECFDQVVQQMVEDALLCRESSTASIHR